MKKSSREALNLFFSSFLIIGFIVCSYFFMTLTTRVAEGVATVIQLVVYLLFGLLMFYATRVGEGTPVKRFSLVVLLVLDLPALLIILASLAQNFPLHTELASQPVVMLFACVALGYGVPYTFLSGFEMIEDKDDDDTASVVEGGIAEELIEVEADAENTDTETDEPAPEVEDEAVDDEAPQEESEPEE